MNARVWTAPNPVIGVNGDILPEVLLQYQKLLVNNWEWACRGGTVYQKTDVYMWVIEAVHRGWFEKYSSCADLAHFGYESLGVSLPWVNRHENGGWRVGKNISLLYPQTNSCSRPGTPFVDFRAGDVMVIANHGGKNDDHAVCVVDAPEEGKLLTAEYGATYPIGGRLTERTYQRRDSSLVVFNSKGGSGKKLQCILHLQDVLETAARTGLLSKQATERVQ